MAKKGRQKVKLQSEASKYFRTTDKSTRAKVGKEANEKTNPGGKLQLMKYDPIVRKHVLFKETRIK